MQALFEYEKYKRQNGEIQLPASSLPHTSGEKEVGFCFFIFYNSVMICLVNFHLPLNMLM